MSTHTTAPSPLKTLFLSSPDVMQIIRRLGVRSCLADMAEMIQQDYLRWHDFDKSKRLAIYSDHGVIELMPIADASHYSFKYVNGHPGNTRRGLPTVMALGALSDTDTGFVRMLSELTFTTALRTAATSAMAARALARPDSDCMALIGSGAQGEFQALAFYYLLGIRRLQVFDIDRAAAEKLEHNLRAAGLDKTCLDIVVCESAEQALHGADIVTTATADQSQARVFDAVRVEPGMHLNAVGGDSPGKTELDPLVLQSGRVFVEFEPQTRIEGEIQQMPGNFPVTALWQVLAGNAPGRQSADQVTIFDSVGFALEDFSALRFMYDKAQELGLGVPVSIMPTLSNPKDLFGSLGLRDIATDAVSAAEQ
ncbi:MAG: ornithine cyclodeaminase [Alcaligenaceae bacterium]|nr:ornithine cyclodeaminase [Alcaligenaceae bacterium]